MNDLEGFRVLAVHAHPDDESITTAAALADCARRGAQTTVVTCTLGEEGEVIGQKYQELSVDHADQLGGFRISELARALEILGVRGEHLGAAGRYRDSGMAGSPAHDKPRAFVRSGQQAVDDLSEILQRLRPHLILTYGPDGGYGHPDHIRAHHITHEASASLDYEPRILWAVAPRQAVHEAMAAVNQVPEGWRREDEQLAVVDSADAWVEMDEELFCAKREAMRAHATQLLIAEEAELYALSNLIAQPLLHREYYQVGAGSAPTTQNDLLSGLEP